MKTRSTFLCLAGLAAALLASTTQARGIRFDFGADPTVAPDCNINNSGAGTTQVSPVDSFASNLNPNAGAGLTLVECHSGPSNDSLFNAADSVNLYVWESAHGTLTTPPAVNAEVMDYLLSSGDESADASPVSLGGLTEIEFNYASCSGAGPADLTMGAATYTASCAGTNDSSLLFNGTTLFGWLDDNNDVHSSLDGSGWSTNGSTGTGVPEPGTFALLGLAVLPVLLIARRRRARVL